MVAVQHPFLKQLKADEHLYLFSQSSIKELLHRLGADHIAFEPAVFAHYDMFFVASRQPLTTYSSDEIVSNLQMRPTGRLIQAMLDLDDRRLATEHKNAEAAGIYQDLLRQFEASEADREARLRVIEERGAQLDKVNNELENLQTANIELQTCLQSAFYELNALRREVSILQYIHERQSGVLSGITATHTYRLMRRLGRWDWVEKAASLDVDEAARQMSASPESQSELVDTSKDVSVDDIEQSDSKRVSSHNGQPGNYQHERAAALADYQAFQTDMIARNPSRELVAAIRDYNHYMVDTLNQLYPLDEQLMLDVGASPHGFALERAVELGALYVGVGLDVMPDDSGCVLPGAYLFYMDAQHLQLPSSVFDCALCVSAFEHITDPALALEEISRILKPGGYVLISFDTIWSSSTGHHLIYFGDLRGVVPPYAHLYWSADEMRAHLNHLWSNELPISIEEAINHVYVDSYLNRRDVRYFKELFNTSSLETQWIVELKDENTPSEIVSQVAQTTGYTSDELTTRGISVFLRKPNKPEQLST